MFFLKKIQKLEPFTKKMIKEIRHRGIAELGAKYATEAVASDGRHGVHKYLNIEPYVKRDVHRAFELRLEKPGRRKTIVDIGTGMGYFPFICRELGHRAYGIDKDDPETGASQIYKESTKILDIPRLSHEITPYCPIPIPAEWPPVDIFTANQIQFNKQGRGDRSPEVSVKERWDSKEWEAFINDLLLHTRNKNAFFILSFNKPDSWDFFLSPELEVYFKTLGATIINGRKVIISPPT